MAETCPHCKRAMPKPKTPQFAEIVDTSALSDAEVRAYYKRTAPYEDVRFYLREGSDLSPELRQYVEDLLAKGVPSKQERALLACKWRVERQRAERAA